MNTNKKIFAILLLWFMSYEFAYSQDTNVSDTLLTSNEKHLIDSMLNRPRGLNSITEYYANSNKELKKGFDLSAIGAPLYNSETSFGIGVITSGLYRINKKDSLVPISDINLICKGTLTGYYNFELEGNHNTRLDKIRIYYDLRYFSYPQLYWGRGFANGENNSTRTKLTKKVLHAAFKPTFKIANYLYIGPSVTYDWIRGVNIESDSLLFGESNSTSTLNLGAAIIFDSRDVTYNAYKGFYINLEQRNYVHFGGNVPFFKTIADVRFYTPLWKSAILALRTYGEFSYRKVPWTMKSRGNGNTILRSYYEGRYEDDNMIAATLELRQRIWKRFGAVAWIGGGNMFSAMEPFDWKHTLSDMGLGLRFEFKKRLNIRFDLGFGRCGQTSLVFGLKEAF